MSFQLPDWFGTELAKFLVFKVVGPLLMALIVFLWIRRGRGRLIWKCCIFNRNKLLRVSCAEILLLQARGRFVLVESLHRNPFFSPLGGVIKFLPAAEGILTQMGFAAESRSGEAARDLRGRLPSKNIFQFLDWLKSKHGIEQGTLSRELAEELRECGFPFLAKDVGIVQQREIRTIFEGPEDVPGANYQQLRIISVFELQCSDPHTRNIADQIVALVPDSSCGLIAVSETEITRGISQDGKHIGSHAAYLFGSHRYRGDAPPVEFEDK